MDGRVAWIRHAASGAAQNSGNYGAAQNSGRRGTAQNSGDYGTACATGRLSTAATTGANSHIECGPGGICAVVAERVTWKVDVDAVLIQRWADGGTYHMAVLIPRKLRARTNDVLVITKGKVIEHRRTST